MSVERPPVSGEASTEPSNIEKAFAADNFENSLRNQQREKWQEVDTDSYDSLSAYSDSVRELTKQYILDTGVTEDDPKFGEYFSAARKYSWDKMNDQEWNIGAVDSDNPDDMAVPGRMKFTVGHEELFGYQISTDGARRIGNIDGAAASAPAGPTPEEIDEAHRMNDELDGERAAASAERDSTLAEAIEKRNAAQHASDLAFADRMKARFWEKGRFQEALDESRAELDAVTREVEAAQIAVWQAAGQTDEQIAEALAQRGDTRANDRADSRHQALVDSTRFGKSFEWYSNLSRGKKLLVKLGVGAIVAVSAAVATATLGIGGSVVAVGGTAISRGYRAYTLRRAEIYGNGGADPGAPEPEKIAHKNADGSLRSHDEIIDEAQQRDDENLNNQIEQGDKIKRRAFLIGAGSVAVGSVMLLAEHAADAGMWGHDSSSSHAAAQPTKPEMESGGSGASGDGSGAHEPVPTVDDSSHEPVPTVDGTGHESVPTVAGPDAATEAVRIINSGEGWYQTFSEMGIANPHDQAALLNDDVLMGKLANMHLAYPDNSVGGWGIRMTADGHMPQTALDLIHQHAVQHSYALVG